MAYGLRSKRTGYARESLTRAPLHPKIGDMTTRTEGLPTIEIWCREMGGTWYGAAACGEKLVATSTGSSREEAERVLNGCLPAGASTVSREERAVFADRIVRMLAAIEAGDESEKRFELAPEYLPERAASVYRLVAAIPIGYASSYGRIAEAAGAIAREVGRLMASNPLYPLVPCHRVVGSDYSLVGYRGRTSGPDLDDKLARLKAEARGFREEIEIPGARGLAAFPVERVLTKAGGEDDRSGQLGLW